MNFIYRILLLLGGAALLGALIAPWVYALSVQFFSYPFDKILNRCVLGWVVVLLIVFRKQLFTVPLSKLGLSRTPGWSQDLIYGLVFGTCSIFVLLFLLYSLDARVLDINILTLRFLKRFFEAGATACFVGFFEEVFFRGFILYGLLQVQRRWVAVMISSLFYALTHFLKAEAFQAPEQITVLFSLKSLLVFLEPLSRFLTLLPHFFGLFLVGVILAYACLKTQRLYFSIGLHAAWVYWMKLDSSFLDYTYLAGEKWFFGDGQLINGILGWSFLLSIIIWIYYFVPMKGSMFNVQRSTLFKKRDV